MNLIQLDKSGSDIFEKDYSIVLVYNKKYFYGTNISQYIKDHVLHKFRTGTLWKPDAKNDRMRLRVRFHTAIIILLLQRCISDFSIKKDIIIEICNDYDGHFHEIKDMVYKNLLHLLSFLAYEDIVQVKFTKPSLIDEIGKKFRMKETRDIENLQAFTLKKEDLVKILKR